MSFDKDKRFHVHHTASHPTHHSQYEICKAICLALQYELCNTDGSDATLSGLFENADLSVWNEDNLRCIIRLVLAQADMRLYNQFFLGDNWIPDCFDHVFSKEQHKYIQNVKQSPHEYNNHAVCIAILFSVSLPDDDPITTLSETLLPLFRIAHPNEWEPDHLMIVGSKLIQRGNVCLLHTFLTETQADLKANDQLMYTIFRRGTLQELSDDEQHETLRDLVTLGFMSHDDIPESLRPFFQKHCLKKRRRIS